MTRKKALAKKSPEIKFSFKINQKENEMISGENNKALIEETLQSLILGSEDTPQILSKLINLLMLAKREATLRAGPFERSDDRTGFANGFKERKYLSRIGELDLKVPQTRDVPFYPSCLEKGERTERALMNALAEAYVQGVSTRKVEKMVKELCSATLSSTTVSKYAKVLDEEVEKFKNRELGEYQYLYLDAQYEKVRHEGCVRSLACLKAVGVTTEGRRELLGISCRLSEAEVHWREFLQGLQKRGMHGIELVISDAHEGLQSAKRAIMPSVKWQRCLFHLAQNAGHYAPTKAMQKELQGKVKQIYSAISREEAEQRMKKIIEEYESKAKKFCIWLEENFKEGLTFYDYPEEHWKKIRTNNLMERMNREQKRRTRVAGLFPSVASCERLVISIGIRIHEEWAVGKRYLINA